MIGVPAGKIYVGGGCFGFGLLVGTYVFFFVGGSVGAVEELFEKVHGELIKGSL